MAGPTPSYQTIDIIDSASGDAVVFSNSGNNTYLSSINVTLNHSPQTEAVEINQSTFAGSAGLNVSTTGGVQVLSGTLSTNSGAITLSGNTAASVSGNLIGVDVQSPVSSTTGPITLTGTSGSGTTPGDDVGVRLTNSGLISSGSGGVSITGTPGVNSVDDAVELLGDAGHSVGISASSGNLQILGNAYAHSNGVAITSGAMVSVAGY